MNLVRVEQDPYPIQVFQRKWDWIQHKKSAKIIKYDSKLEFTTKEIKPGSNFCVHPCHIQYSLLYVCNIVYFYVLAITFVYFYVLAITFQFHNHLQLQLYHDGDPTKKRFIPKNSPSECLSLICFFTIESESTVTHTFTYEFTCKLKSWCIIYLLLSQ